MTDANKRIKTCPTCGALPCDQVEEFSYCAMIDEVDIVAKALENIHPFSTLSPETKALYSRVAAWTALDAAKLAAMAKVF